jgi:FKBP-type peptidyl-prolyl cis-trans isomerase FklB
LPTTQARISYAVGANLGMTLAREKCDPDMELVLRGIKEAMAGKSELNFQQIRQAFMNFQQERDKVAGAKNREAGNAFLAANASKPGVKSLATGLQYEVLKEGEGDSPRSEDTVTVNYRGTLVDGTEFDSSYSRNQPAVFGVSAVIPAWTEALKLMKPGSKWKIVAPPEIAYGEGGYPPKIGPNSTLVFEIELLEVKKNEPVTSDIIKVPSAEELQKGAKIEVIKQSDLERIKKEEAEKKKAAEAAPAK